MDPEPSIPKEPGAASLMRGILSDGQDLLQQQIQLFRSEIRQELKQLRSGLVSLFIGGVIAGMGAIFLFVMLAQLLAATTAIPLWGCYGIVGGGLIIAGIATLAGGRKSVAEVQLAPPPVTAQALKENVEWLKNIRHGKTADTTTP
jgi:hypothetical protein